MSKDYSDTEVTVTYKFINGDDITHMYAGEGAIEHATAEVKRIGESTGQYFYLYDDKGRIDTLVNGDDFVGAYIEINGEPEDEEAEEEVVHHNEIRR